jgi:hypothetical protein
MDEGDTMHGRCTGLLARGHVSYAKAYESRIGIGPASHIMRIMGRSMCSKVWHDSWLEVRGCS